MEYKDLDYKLKLSEESEFKNLYEWKINEIDNGEVKGRDFSPSEESLFFVASELNYLNSLEYGDRYAFGDDYEDDPEKLQFNKEERIHGILNVRNLKKYRQTTFKIFGKDKEIEDMHLFIYPSEKESVHVTAVMGFETEIDFETLVTDDSLHIEIYVKEDEFKILSERVISKNIINFGINVSRVKGFYSEWTPELSTDLIKILTSKHVSEGLLEIPDDLKIDYPVVGRGLKHLNFHYSTKLDLLIGEEELDEEDEEDAVHPASKEKPSKIISFSNKIMKKLEEQPIWWVVIVILLIIFFSKG